MASARAGLGDLRLGRERLGPWLRARAASEETGPVEVHLTSEAEERSVALDGALLGRALHNLFANAWAHGHPRELPLVVMVTLTGGRARIVVRDRGPGFPEDLLPRAFEPFVMGRDPARSKPRPKDAATRASASAPHGLGLGLSLVRRIVEAHGGIVSAANVVEDGRLAGAEITIELDTVLT